LISSPFSRKFVLLDIVYSGSHVTSPNTFPMHMNLLTADRLPKIEDSFLKVTWITKMRTTPRSGILVLLKKLLVYRLLKKRPAFYGIRRLSYSVRKSLPRVHILRLGHCRKRSTSNARSRVKFGNILMVLLRRRLFEIHSTLPSVSGLFVSMSDVRIHYVVLEGQYSCNSVMSVITG
jgi:hypothetical protein